MYSFGKVAYRIERNLIRMKYFIHQHQTKFGSFAKEEKSPENIFFLSTFSIGTYYIL